MEEIQNRENWIAVMNNGRYIVVDKTTGITIYDAQGYGFQKRIKMLELDKESTTTSWYNN
jgi:hypothetical protein